MPLLQRFTVHAVPDGPTFAKMREYAGLYSNSLDESNDVNTDWQDLMYRNGYVTSHDISVNGGTKGGNYSFGLGYYQDQGVIPTQKYTRYSLRGSIEQKLGDILRVGLTTNSNYNITNGTQVGIYNVLTMTPIANPYNEDGSLKRSITLPNDSYYTITRDVVENLDDSWVNDRTAIGTYNNFFAELSCPWVEGLKYRVNLGLNYRSSKVGAFTGEGVTSTTVDTPSTASLQHEETVNWAVENLLTYDRTFNDKHRLNVVGMFSAEETTYSKSHIAARDIPAEYMQYYNLGQAAGTITVNPGNWNYQRYGLMSYMARAMYTYDNRYMFSATVRSDASSRLAKGHQWHTYPAVSVGWNIKEESFMDNIKWLDQLKIRAGYGQTSNQAVNPYSTLGSLSTRPYNFGPTGYATGYYVSSLPNAELGWEYSSTWNFGLDFTLFQGRLSGTLEYYIQKTNNLLQSVNLPGTTGVGSYMANVGKTQNKGIEFTINGTILDNYNGWTWDASLNIYSNKNEITELASGAEKDEANWWFVGHPIDVIYDYEKLGLWNADDPDAQYLQILEPGGNLGMIKVKYTGERNPDGSPTRAIGAEDRQKLDTNPKFQGGFSTRVAYKGFDLNIIGAFKYGGILISTLHSSSGYLNMLSGRRGNVDVDYWTEENTDAKYPKPGGIMSSDNPKYGSTLGYFDASYWKIRTITLGYTFDNQKQKWLRDLGVDNLRAYFTVQNPFVICSPFHKETGLDPETNSYANENVAVASGPSRLLTVGTNSPSTRNYLFGISLTF